MKNFAEKLVFAGFLVFACTVSWTMSGQAAGVVLALAGWIAGVFAYKKFIWTPGPGGTRGMWGFTVFELCLLAFVAVLIVSSAFSVNIVKSFNRTFLLLGEIGLFFAVVSFNWDEKKISKFIKLLTVFAVLESVYAIIQYFTGTTVLNYADTKKRITELYYQTYWLRRAYGTWDHFNSLGGILAMIIPVIFFAGIASARPREKCFYFISALVVLFALALTFTRGAWIGLLVSLTVLAVYKRRMLFFVPLALLVLMMAIPATRARVVNTFSFAYEIERINIWRIAFGVIKENPILGAGPETFQEAFYTRKLPEKTDNIYFLKREHFHYHNIYLGLCAESGLISLVLFLAFVCGVLAYGFRNLAGIESKFAQGALLGFTGTVIDFMVHGLVDYNLRGNTVYFFYFACGMAVYLADRAARINPGESGKT
ncbi:MAG: hypothetical protein A2297_00240 [Elusimicrobia bacterium RIFOXYB2_FULL_48_7]|nr:MAG: hypothetical protein A2297_00240 [Elusimicrobia bacterium RIFOXYB2_FULL_48_7]